jgi:hypothetical protein
VADLLVPIGQALVTGALLAGLLVFVLSELVAGVDGDLLKMWAGAGLAISTVAWLLLLVDTRRLLWAVERVTGLDIDGDQQVGKPGERLVILNAGQARQEAAQLDNAQRASNFARFVAALPVKGTAARTWEPILTRPVYQDYRDALIRLGWARWASVDGDGRPNERRGWELTQDPAEIVRRISG